MKIFYCFLMLLYTSFSNGQNGYMGKKVSVFFGINSSFLNRIYTPKSDSIKILTNDYVWLTSRPMVQINCVLSKYREFSFAIEHINSLYSLDSIYHFKGNSYTANYRIYEKSKGSIAPIGKYLSTGLLLNQSKYYIDKERSKNMTTIGLSIGVGIQRAIYNKFLINLSYDTWLPIHSFYTKEKYYVKFPITPQDYISELAKSNLVSIKIKLGYLIY